MDEKSSRLLGQVKAEGLGGRGGGQLKDLPFAELGYATVDTHRSLRFGVPEVVLGEPKTVEQLLGIVGALVERKQTVLVTRLQPEKAEALLARFPQGQLPSGGAHLPLAAREAQGGQGGGGDRRGPPTSRWPRRPRSPPRPWAPRCGASTTWAWRAFTGCCGGARRSRTRTRRWWWRGWRGRWRRAVGGLVGIPVVAVPTSVGYGANFGGVSALLAMLNSCASNVATMNIDNGFGGGFYAALVSRTKGRR